MVCFHHKLISPHTCSQNLQLPPSPGDPIADPPVRAGGHLLHGHALDRLLDRALGVRADALHAALDGRLEEGDVALPPGRPLGRLRGHALRGARHHHVEGREGRGAGAGEEEHLGAGGGGDADGDLWGVLITVCWFVVWFLDGVLEE